MTEQHQPRGRKVLGVGAMALVLSAAALFAPASWFERIGQLFGAQQPATTPFTPDVVELDESLDARAGKANAELLPYVAARRLTRAGPMTAKELEEAARTLDTAMKSGDPASFDEAQRVLIERLPRLDAEVVRRELAPFRPSPGGGPRPGCDGCHSEMLALPEGRKFDLAGIYPFAAKVEAFEGGRRVPALTESIELAARQVRMTPADDLFDADCGTCHVGHDDPGFGVELEERVENMGMWVNIIDSDPQLLHVQVKVQNRESGHRSPGGRISPGYIVSAVARQGEKQLAQRYGRRLPSHLRRDGMTAGCDFSRVYLDASGRRTTDPARIVDLASDMRIESGRFGQIDFGFDRVDKSVATVEVTLWYLPDVMTWKGASAIRRVEKSEE